MKKESIGKTISDLRKGKIIQCPECKKGKMIPRSVNDTHFKCDSCDFVINID